jgi:SPX domain protein involved in polyphosphate accumulation
MEQTGDFPLGRFEHKYLVTDQVAVAVRNAIRPHLAVDVHAPPDSVRGYKVYSLYYDTPHLDFYRQTRAGEKRRVKLRVRFYDHEANSVAFVEVKEKIDGQVYKRRYAADKPFVESMVRNPECDAIKHALGNGARGTALEEFCQRRKELGAVPKLFIAYEREAFNSTSTPPVRVTFDRRIRTNASGRDVRLAVPSFGANVGGLNVLIEFKYAGEPPAWLAEIEQSFLLKRASFSKFAECIDALQIFGSQPMPKRKKKSAAKKAIKRPGPTP